MKKQQLYLVNDLTCELVKTKDEVIEYMKEYEVKEMTVNIAVKTKITGYIWCSIYQVSERGNCGSMCSDYEPRNKVKGMCKYQGNMYEKGKEIKFVI